MSTAVIWRYDKCQHLTVNNEGEQYRWKCEGGYEVDFLAKSTSFNDPEVVAKAAGCIFAEGNCPARVHEREEKSLRELKARLRFERKEHHVSPHLLALKKGAREANELTVLRLIGEKKGRTTGELEKDTGFSRSTLAEILDRLLRKTDVTRMRRKAPWQITKTGKKNLELHQEVSHVVRTAPENTVNFHIDKSTKPEYIRSITLNLDPLIGEKVLKLSKKKEYALTLVQLLHISVIQWFTAIESHGTQASGISTGPEDWAFHVFTIPKGGYPNIRETIIKKDTPGLILGNLAFDALERKLLMEKQMSKLRETSKKKNTFQMPIGENIILSAKIATDKLSPDAKGTIEFQLSCLKCDKDRKCKDTSGECQHMDNPFSCPQLEQDVSNYYKQFGVQM